MTTGSPAYGGPPDTPQRWLHPATGQPLPTGAITLVTSPPGPPWPCVDTDFLSLITETVRGGRPVAYVQTGGMQSLASGESLQADLDSPLLLVDNDLDLVVRGPASQMVPRDTDAALARPVDADGRPWYSCNIPTMHAIGPRVAAHEERFGPALVVLDEIAWARPYWQFIHDGERLEPTPGGLELEPTAAFGWLATDLLTYAQERTQAPTVVVANHEGVAAGHLLPALEGIAHVVLRTSRGGDETVDVQ